MIACPVCCIKGSALRTTRDGGQTIEMLSSEHPDGTRDSGEVTQRTSVEDGLTVHVLKMRARCSECHTVLYVEQRSYQQLNGEWLVEAGQ